MIRSSCSVCAILLLLACSVEPDGDLSGGSSHPWSPLQAHVVTDAKDGSAVESALPTLALEVRGAETASTPDGVSFVHMGPYYPLSECVNMGSAYRAPSYFVRMRVTGPRGALVHKFNYQVSCAARGAAEWMDPVTWTIPSSGELLVDYTQDTPLPCDSPLLGRWRSYVVVEGVRSADSYITFHQAACSGFASLCSTASSYCPATGP